MLQVNSGLTTSWSTAESDCISMGGHLASIHSTTENNFILSKLTLIPLSDFVLL